MLLTAKKTIPRVKNRALKEYEVGKSLSAAQKIITWPGINAQCKGELKKKKKIKQQKGK